MVPKIQTVILNALTVSISATIVIAFIIWCKYNAPHVYLELTTTYGGIIIALGVAMLVVLGCSLFIVLQYNEREAEGAMRKW